MLKVIYLISKDGAWNGKQLIPADYVRKAHTKQSDPYGKSGTIEEMQGYGYKIWMTRNGGYALYGMAGQLALYVPDKDIYMVTTADTQGRRVVYSVYMMHSGKKYITSLTIARQSSLKHRRIRNSTWNILKAGRFSRFLQTLHHHMRI